MNIFNFNKIKQLNCSIKWNNNNINNQIKDRQYGR